MNGKPRSPPSHWPPRPRPGPPAGSPRARATRAVGAGRRRRGHGPSPAAPPRPAAMRRGGSAAIAACLAGTLAVLVGPGPWPGAGGTAWSGRRPPRSYGHLEGDVRWRRLFSATRFFLRIDGGGRVEGTRWRERPGSIVEIRSVRVGVVAIRAVHTGFYLAMNKQGRLYGSKRDVGGGCSRCSCAGHESSRFSAGQSQLHIPGVWLELPMSRPPHAGTPDVTAPPTQAGAGGISTGAGTEAAGLGRAGGSCLSPCPSTHGN